MNVRAYYNEIDPFAAAWLRNLIAAGHIADGDVDERSIVDVRPGDLAGYTQCHFFAGIGGWSYALRLAGWPDERPVWTGSCPCQPFSAAGKRKGFADERHLWPEFRRLISECNPAVLFGEQVASAADWLRLVRGDLEALGYAVGAVPVEAASAGADHLRDRFWFVADRAGQQVGTTGQPRQRGDVVNDPSERRGEGRPEHGVWSGRDTLAGAGGIFMADADQSQRWLGDEQSAGQQPQHDGNSGTRAGGYVALAHSGNVERGSRSEQARLRRAQIGATPDLEWVTGADGKARRVKSGIRLLVNGASASLDRLRAIENRIASEMNAYAAHVGTDSGEALRILRQGLSTQVYAERAIGGSRRLSTPAVLLNLLLCIDAVRDGAAVSRGLSKTLTENHLRVVRSMWPDIEPVGPSCGRQSDEQRADEPSDALPALSQLLARHVEAHRQAARDAHAASSRVGMLRGFGNAIDPRPASEIIRAYRDIERGSVAT